MAAPEPGPPEAAPEPPADARWFVALRPDEAARERLFRIAARIARETHGRATPAERIHLTLVFVGQAPRSREAEMLALVRALPPAQALVLSRTGGFGARLAWIGPESCPDWLQSMSERARQGLDALGVAYDRKRFVAHLTLVRGARAPVAGRGAPPPGEPDLVTVERWSAHLVESRLDSRGSRYRWL
jgi:2'-5' RNA ligase